MNKEKKRSWLATELLLSELEEEILSCRLSQSKPTKTLAKIGSNYGGLCRESIRKKEEKLVRKIKGLLRGLPRRKAALVPTICKGKTCTHSFAESIEMSVDQRIFLATPVSITPEFSQRTKNCFRKKEIITMCDVVSKTRKELLSIKNFGIKGLNEVSVLVSKAGLPLGLRLNIFSKHNCSTLTMDKKRNLDCEKDI